MATKEKPKNKGKNKGHDNLIPIKKGESLNPNGRPKGQRNYTTILRDAMIKIGNANDKTPEEMETLLQEVGLKNAAKGDFKFWKEINDRLYGTAVQKTQSVNVNLSASVESKKAKELAEQYEEELKKLHD